MKLYVIVRGDLPPGAQLAQACHALRLFGAEYPRIDEHWYRTSNNLVCLQVPDEATLHSLHARVTAAGIAASLFTEPDFADEATALALEPAAARLISALPLALRSAAPTSPATRPSPHRATAVQAAGSG